MIRYKFLDIKTFIPLTLFIIGCASVKYIGKSYEPTTSVDVYYSEKDIKKEYEVMGHAIGRGPEIFVSDEQVHKKLIEKARQKGADAIILTGVDVDIESTGESSVQTKEFEATFIKYKSSTEDVPDQEEPEEM
jgi:hypothetical protein